MSTVGRRGFLGGMAAALTVAATPINWVGRAFGAVPTASPADTLARLFRDAAGTERIGEAYLAVAPVERDASALFAALAPEGETPDEWWGHVGVAELRRTLRKRAHNDFAVNDVVDLEGWQLARTECRLAALFTLTR
ncbi:MAG: hypothetical protein EXQ79_00905 [Acidimicrobiia bacterium]|nr:hypothetical protein [Acidimicrobiia bacterium]